MRNKKDFNSGGPAGKRSRPEQDKAGSKPGVRTGKGAYAGKREFAARDNAPKARTRPVQKPTEKVFDEGEAIRLNRYIANSGVCSRRDADGLITQGLITVNGKVVTELGSKVKVSDDVRYNGKRLNPEEKVYILINKPRDMVTTTDDPQGRRTVMDLVEGVCTQRIYPVGRLDRNTTGVLLLTNDGELSRKLTHPSSLTKKIYHVFLDRPIARQHMTDIKKGIELEDGLIQADDIGYADESDHSQIGIEIHSGRNRVVRRIFETLGYKVEKLDRVYFAGLTKKNLAKGHWRFLTKEEIRNLKTGLMK